MANYTKINNFTAKDSLASGDVNKRVRGTEFDAEFNAISSAIATKPDSAGVTSVSGTGTASGLTLSGTVTSTGNLTLGGTVNSLAAGTYGIDISGNAATATTATTATTAGSVTGISISSSTMTINGSAPAFPARLFCSFINNATPTILHSGNVSSVVNIATGRVRINVATALQTSNYCFVSGVHHPPNSSYNSASVTGHDIYRGINNTTQIPVSYYNTSGGQTDGNYMYVAVFAN